MIQSALLVMLAWLIVNGVDRVMSWQTFARPIVTAAITGLVLGDLTTGVVMGAVSYTHLDVYKRQIPNRDLI